MKRFLGLIVMLLFCLVGCDSPKNAKKQRHERSEQKHFASQPDNIVSEIADSAETKENVQGNQPLKDTIIIPCSLEEDTHVPEDFNEFIERFHSDTVFQQQRVVDEVTGFFPNEYIEDVLIASDTIIHSSIWDKQELHLKLKGINYDREQPEFETLITVKSDSVITEDVYIPATSFYYFLEFSLIENKWVLTWLGENY